MVSRISLKNKNQKIGFLNLLLAVVGFSIPFSFAFNSIAIGVLFLYSFIGFKKNKYTFSNLKNEFGIHVLFIIYFLIQFIGVFYSDDLNLGFKYIIQNSVFLILPITFINLSDVMDYKKLKYGLYGFVIAVLIILLSIHVNIFNKILSQHLDYNSLLFHFVRVNFVQEGFVQIHPPYFGLMVVFSLVVVLKTTFSRNTVFNGIIKFFLMGYLLLSLYGISAFIPIILVLLLLVIYLIYLIKEKKFKLLLSILLPVLLVVIIAGSIINAKSISKFPGESLLGRIEWSFIKGKGDTSRPENWKSVISVIKDHPLIGVGTDGGLTYLQVYRSKTSESYINKHNAHNQYLETQLRHGILGFIVLLMIFYSLILRAKKSRDSTFCAFIFIFMIASITESYLMRQIGLTFFIFYALLFSTFYNFGNDKKALE